MPQMMQGNIPVVSSGPPRGSGMYKYLTVGVQNAHQVCAGTPAINQMSSNSFQSVDIVIFLKICIELFLCRKITAPTVCNLLWQKHALQQKTDS